MLKLDSPKSARPLIASQPKLALPVIYATLSLLLIFFFGGCVNAQKSREEAEFRLRLGTSYLASGNNPGALSELLAGEQLDPDNALIQNNLGLVYFLSDRLETSLSHFDRAIKVAPKFNEARNNRARTLIELGRYDQAIAELKIVLNDLTYPDPVKAWINLGVAYFRKQDFPEAKDRFAKALKLNRNNCLAATYYGRSLFEMGRLDDAAQSLDNAVVVCKPVKFDEPHYFSGLAYYKLGNTTSAIARMEEVTQLFPQGEYAKKAESLLKLMR